MNRNPNRPHLQISTLQQDSRIKSKCTTPKQQSKNKNNNNNNINKSIQNEQQDNQKTHYKNIQYLQFLNKKSVRKSKQKDRLLQQDIQDQVKKYQIVGGTLKQYIKQKQNNSKNGNNKKYVRTVIQIIKAYTKSQVDQISPALSQLINKMLQTLQLCQAQNPKKSNSTQKQKHKKSIKQQSLPQLKKLHNNHSRQFSFSKSIKKLAPEIQLQINQLQQELEQLKLHGQTLQEYKKQFQQMNQQDKLLYIKQLEEIVKKQNQMLHGYQNS